MMTMKSIFGTMIALCLLLVTSDVVAKTMFSEADTISVYYNGQAISFDQPPELVDQRTMVPLRAIFEAFGMTVNWEQENLKITMSKEDLEIELILNEDIAMVNGNEIQLDVSAYAVNGRTMVPLRFIAESTGAQVIWHQETYSVEIIDTDLSEETQELVLNYKIVDTGVERFYTDDSTVSTISQGSAFYGQDANYHGYQADYTDNQDGTITDNVTGLMWQQTMDEKMTYEEALVYAENCTLGGYDDWRIPSIKELFSLIMFYGESGGEAASILYIDTDYFNQPIGDVSLGEREIDAQVWSSTKYVSDALNTEDVRFGVNFIDGRIKGYPETDPRTKTDKAMYFRLVRGNEDYGENIFVDNGDGTISDLATGLMWQMADDGQTRDWEDALYYAENLDLAGYDDWRLPNAKELQSIVDYDKSPDTTESPAIDDLFILTPITDPNGNMNYGYYWTGTTHRDGPNKSDSATYVAFGEAQGEMFGEVIDVHGAGAVRSDPKSGYIEDYESHGPQGDLQYIYNYVLAVRDISN